MTRKTKKGVSGFVAGVKVLRKPFRGKVAIIPDAGDSVGGAVAELFARMGGKLVVADPRKETLDSLSARFKRMKTKLLAVQGDICQEGFIDNLVKVAVEKFGGVDHILVNPAFPDSIRFLRSHSFVEEEWFQVNSSLESALRYLKRIDEEQGRVRERSVTFIYPVIPEGADLQDYQRQREELGHMTSELADDWKRLSARVNTVSPSSSRLSIGARASVSELLDPVAVADVILALMWDPFGGRTGRLIEPVFR